MISFQPSEMAKFVVVVYLSYFIAKKGARIRDFMNGLVPAYLVTGIFLLLAMRQPDFGAALTIGAGRVHPVVCGRGKSAAPRRNCSGSGSVYLFRGRLQGLPAATDHGFSRPLVRSARLGAPDHPVLSCFRQRRVTGRAGRRKAETAVSSGAAFGFYFCRDRRGTGADRRSCSPRAVFDRSCSRGMRIAIAGQRYVHPNARSRHHAADLPAGGNQHGRRNGSAPDEGNSAPAHELRRIVPGDHDGRAGRAAEYIEETA